MPSFTIELRPQDVRLFVGFPVGSGFVPWPTVFSLLQAQKACVEREIEITIDGTIGNSIVVDARNLVLHRFLKSDATHLFWIDADMEFDPGQFLRLVALGTKLPLVGATYPTKTEPMLYAVKRPDGDWTLNEYGCVKIEGMGLGFTIMQREPLERLAATKPVVKGGGVREMEIADVFRLDTVNGHSRGEDMAFFSDLRELGYDAWLDPMLDVGHVGLKIYRGKARDALVLGGV